MYYTDEMISILNECGYSVDLFDIIFNLDCDIYFLGTYIDTVCGKYGLYNWMCDRELL